MCLFSPLISVVRLQFVSVRDVIEVYSMYCFTSHTHTVRGTQRYPYGDVLSVLSVVTRVSQ